MLETGKLVANEEYVFDREFYAPVYDWLYKQMVKRIGVPPDDTIRYPVWAWYQRDGKRRKPDMRQTAYATKGERIVRLTIEVNDEDVVLSDFDLYHYPLNYWYLPLNEEEGKMADEKYPSIWYQQDLIRGLLLEPANDPMFCEMLWASWDRIFDLSIEDDGYLFGTMDRKSIQATMWQLNLENVIKVEEFIAR
jgi:hypothetical protein